MVKNLKKMSLTVKGKKKKQQILNYYVSRSLVDNVVSNLTVRGRSNYLRQQVYKLVRIFKALYLNAYRLWFMCINKLRQHFAVFIEGVKTKRKPYRLIRIYQVVNRVGMVQSYQKAFLNLRRGLNSRKEQTYFSKLFNELYDTFKAKKTPAVLRKRLDYIVLWHKLSLRPKLQQVFRYYKKGGFGYLWNPKKNLNIKRPVKSLKKGRLLNRVEGPTHIGLLKRKVRATRRVGGVEYRVESHRRSFLSHSTNKKYFGINSQVFFLISRKLHLLLILLYFKILLLKEKWVYFIKEYIYFNKKELKFNWHFWYRANRVTAQVNCNTCSSYLNLKKLRLINR